MLHFRGTSGGICNILGRAGNMAAPFAVYAVSYHCHYVCAVDRGQGADTGF